MKNTRLECFQFLESAQWIGGCCIIKILDAILLLWNEFSSIAAAAESLQSCPTLWPHRQKPTRLPSPWDSPGKNIGVGCHFLLQRMKVKSEREVAQLCLTLRDPMDCSPPDSPVHGIFQARVLEQGAIAFSISSIICWQICWESKMTGWVQALWDWHTAYCSNKHLSASFKSIHNLTQKLQLWELL